MTAERLIRGGALAGAALLLAPVAALAADPAHGGGGMPQLNPAYFAPQIFWALVLFALLYYLMSKVALPRIGAVLEERSERIGEDLDKAAQLQQEAEAALAQYEKALAVARNGAQAMLRSAQESAARSTAEAQEKLAAELAAYTREAEGRIDAARQAALDNVRTIAVDAAAAAATRLTGGQYDQGRIAAAVDAVLQERR
jgi:F-type H+-transporting ATPase subunit b